MSKASILIVEDESFIAEELKRIIERLGYTVCAIANRYNEAIDFLNQQRPDLVLLDIQLDYSEKDGVDLAHYINDTFKIPFIYITANADVSTVNRAKNTHPASYILKPFNEQAIFANLEIALFNKTNRSSITVKHNGKNVILECIRISYIKADNMYCEIHTSDDKKYVVRKFMKQLFEEINNDNFVQVHRSYIINKHHIVSYTSEFVFIGKTKIPVGDSYKTFLG
jgi:two-component system response regulator LytT